MSDGSAPPSPSASSPPSPTGSRWFALRRWYRRRPLEGWLITGALLGLANAMLLVLGPQSPAPFLPFYPAIMIATLLGGRPLGYSALAASLICGALFVAEQPEIPPWHILAAALLLSLAVSVLLVEILARLTALADQLRAREAALAGETEALTAKETRLAAALSELESLYHQAPLGLGFLDPDLRFVRINAALAEMNGFTEAEHLGKSVWDLVPDLRPSAEPLLRRVLAENAPVKDVEISGETPAQPGVQRTWREMFYPIHDQAGQVQGIGIFCVEVTEAKQAREREQLLTREVDHRAKNLLTVIQSVLKLTRATDSVEAFKAAVIGRIQSLGRVHTLLADNRWEAVLLDELVRQELAPFGPAVRVGEVSPALRLRPNIAQAVSMILHELATNSAKHGALGGDGHVLFACHRDDNAEDAVPRLVLTWHEREGPPVRPMASRGFGTSLIRSAVSGLLAGELDYDLAVDGLRCVIRFPLEGGPEGT